MDYSAYNLNQPQQQPQSYYEYDPSQIQHQPYDQSYAAYQPSYYAAYNQQYAYYPTDTITHFQHQQTHGYYQSEPAPVHPPGVNPEPVQPNLTIGPSSQYRGRGGRSFRRGGRGRGQFSHGRGRGVGGGRYFPSHSSGPAISDVPGSSSVSTQVQTAPVQPPPRGVFCDICKIECNTQEVMELHLKGKKHLKNIRVHEAKQRRGAINVPQSGQIPTSQLNSTDQTIIAQESEDPTKYFSSEIATDSQKVNIISQNNVGETSDVPAEENSAARGRGLKRKLRGGKTRKQTRTADGSQPEPAVAITCELCNVKCDTQRVYQAHITGKKHLKRAYGPHAPAGLVRNQALVGVGNQALVGVGDQTLSEVGSQALAGVAGLQALYPPDINALATAINAQVQQGDNDPQVLLAQLLVNALSQAQGSATAPPNGSLTAQTPTPALVAGSSYDPQLAQIQVSEIAAQGNPTGESKNETPSAPVESNAQEGSNVGIGIQIEGGSSETK
ncbi:uncharacterized protein LOC131601448 isoform X1 [Vicia villosa]|uniref:uncharacterized protein LOC131601448 isoform X1 n=1 Tax=Vicia villosa TaxID=3911 RepID=UPI00273AD375|nr:uncharacterized protein LOC131601448 isoform X1 [Vicia villosa]